MKVTIRNNTAGNRNLLVAELVDKPAYVFLNTMLDHNQIKKVQKSDSAQCDAVYKMNGDYVFGEGGLLKVFLWKDHTVISVFI